MPCFRRGVNRSIVGFEKRPITWLLKLVFNRDVTVDMKISCSGVAQRFDRSLEEDRWLRICQIELLWWCCCVGSSVDSSPPDMMGRQRLGPLFCNKETQSKPMRILARKFYALDADFGPSRNSCTEALALLVWRAQQPLNIEVVERLTARLWLKGYWRTVFKLTHSEIKMLPEWTKLNNFNCFPLWSAVS